MARYQAILAYDGTHFSGFQRQLNLRTVQGAVEDALRKIGWTGRTIYAAGRTDRGVHALGQVIAFDFDWRHADAHLLRAINAGLPPDAAVRSVQRAGKDFHPRYHAVARRYQYHIICEDVRNPLRERYVWRVWPAVELAPLLHAASHLVGTHDFSAFGTPPRPGGTTVRTVFHAKWTQSAHNELVFEVEANAFLYHMVRRIVQLQVDVARGKFDPGIVPNYLAEAQPTPVQGLAPPQGLFLSAVRYST